MADKIIAAKLQVDTGTSNENIKEVNKNLNEVKGNLKDTGATAAKTGQAVEDAGGNFKNLKGQIGALPGPLGQASQGVTSLSSAFKVLLANPVVLVLTAIIGVLALLYKAFTNTFEGAQKVEQIFSGLKAAGQSLIDNLDKIGSAIKNVFTFNFSGAVKDIEEVTGAAKNAYTAMAALTKQAQDLHKEQLSNDLDQAERAKKLAILREQANDETVSLADRKKALLELRSESEKNAKEDIDLAKRTTDNIIAQATLQKDGALKNQDEINEAKIKQINVETDNANELRRINKQITAAERQEAADRKEVLKEQEERQKENLAKQKEIAAEQEKLLKQRQKLEEDYAKAHREAQAQELKDLDAHAIELAKEQDRIDKAELDRLATNKQNELDTKKKLAELDQLNNPDNPQAKIDLVNANLQLELAAIADNDIQKQILAKQASDAIVQIKEDEVEAKRQLAEIEVQNEQAKVSAIAGALGTLANIAGKQTALGKALSIASTTINTYQSAIAAFRGVVSTIPGPVGIALGAVAAAGALATGIAAVKKIVAVQIPGGGGVGSGGTPSLPTAPAAPLAPTASSTSINQQSINDLGNAAKPIRAYVLDTDSVNNRERNERLNRAARLGG